MFSSVFDSIFTSKVVDEEKVFCGIFNTSSLPDLGKKTIQELKQLYQNLFNFVNKGIDLLKKQEAQENRNFFSETRLKKILRKSLKILRQIKKQILDLENQK